MATRYLACDLGAESGRLIAGTLDRGKLGMDELHRFPNIPIKAGTHLHWNLDQLRSDLLAGLEQAARSGHIFSSFSTDSWGVDYLLRHRDGSWMQPAFHYRDPRCRQGLERAEQSVSRESVFAATGVQFMAINTVYQLMAEEVERLAAADNFLGIGDAFNCLLSGVAAAEVSFASTTSLYSPVARAWSQDLIAALNLPSRIFPRIIPSGSILGPVSNDISARTKLPPIPVIASCSHDTGAAVVAVPAVEGSWAYLSSGTWSLMGVEQTEPIINDTCRGYNLTNEIGYGHSVRLLKNISGLWLLQQCRRNWAEAGSQYDYSTLTEFAAASPPFRSLIDPAHDRFLAPESMITEIAAFCRETDQPEPKTPGEISRCIYESLALLYRCTFRQLETVTGRKLDRLHIVGGGSRNALLNQLAADAVGVPVLAGPVEATALGNVLVQALTLGHIASLAEARRIVAASFPVTRFEPRPDDSWAKAEARMGGNIV